MQIKIKTNILLSNNYIAIRKFINYYIGYKCACFSLAHLHLIVLIVLCFEEKDSEHNNIITDYSSLSYNNYWTTKLEFEEFNISQNNNCLQNINKNNCY